MSFLNESRRVINKLEETQSKNITSAAELVSDSIMNGGILQSFGSGHSYAGAIEISGRAGGLIPTKIIKDLAEGMYERIEGVGTTLMRKVDLNPKDILVLISNSGRNPMAIEIADIAKKKGNKIIVVTSLESSKQLSSRHSSGKKLYEFADVILDNQSPFGDAAISVSDLDTRICATSSLSMIIMLQQMMYESVNLMLKNGYEPPVYKSANIDGGREYNDKLELKYADRIWRY